MGGKLVIILVSVLFAIGLAFLLLRGLTHAAPRNVPPNWRACVEECVARPMWWLCDEGDWYCADAQKDAWCTSFCLFGEDPALP